MLKGAPSVRSYGFQPFQHYETVISSGEKRLVVNVSVPIWGANFLDHVTGQLI
jgi:hypothetical protein